MIDSFHYFCSNFQLSSGLSYKYCIVVFPGDERGKVDGIGGGVQGGHRECLSGDQAFALHATETVLRYDVSSMSIFILHLCQQYGNRQFRLFYTLKTLQLYLNKW